MKQLICLLFFILISSPVLSDNIATIKLSYILDQSLAYQEFLKKLDSVRSSKEKHLSNEENNLKNEKKEIAETSSILSEEESKHLINEFNLKATQYQNEINLYNEYINKNIEYNRKKVFDKVIQIIEQLSTKNNIKLVLNEDQYFISASAIDISDKIIEFLNLESLDLEIIKDNN